MAPWGPWDQLPPAPWGVFLSLLFHWGRLVRALVPGPVPGPTVLGPGCQALGPDPIVLGLGTWSRVLRPRPWSTGPEPWAPVQLPQALCPSCLAMQAILAPCIALQTILCLFPPIIPPIFPGLCSKGLSVQGPKGPFGPRAQRAFWSADTKKPFGPRGQRSFWSKGPKGRLVQGPIGPKGVKDPWGPWGHTRHRSYSTIRHAPNVRHAPNCWACTQCQACTHY